MKTMIEMDYTKIRGKWDNIDQTLKTIIENKFDYIVEDLECGEVVATKVNTPFILADNEFDLREGNNDRESLNVYITEQGSFTGGGFYDIYEVVDKTKPALILHGNGEEGYNIFILN